MVLILHFIVLSGNYNNYLTLNRGTVDVTACNGAARLTTVHCISNDTPLIKLLSLEDRNQNDWLYIVLVDIVSPPVMLIVSYSYMYIAVIMLIFCAD